MNLSSPIIQLNKVSELLEETYHLIEELPTTSDIETSVKSKLLINIKNTLIQNVINVDLMDGINDNPDDITALEVALDVLSEATEILS